MGSTKNEVYTTSQNELAGAIKALGHPARLAILEHLLKKESCMCGDIVDELDLAQATVSQHLKELKRVGLITGDIEGRTICYCIDRKRWNELRCNILSFLVPLEQQNKCC